MHLAPALRTVAWLLVSGSLGACSRSHEPMQTTLVATHAAVAATANVPALLGLSIDDLHSRLGSQRPLPGSFSTLPEMPQAANELTNADSLTSFQAGGLTLIANYNAHTRQVHELLVLGHHEDSLMARAALRSSASHYLVLPIFASSRPNYLLGLRIVPVN
jgi:hypothetical protein